MNTYKVLSEQIFKSGSFSLVPIRFEDGYDIMQWRNEQIYHLRQAKPFTKEEQDTYFENIVAKLFDQDQPSQILFSFLEDGVCRGYGGLVHINWIDRNAEISFVMDTKLENTRFHSIWSIYLYLIEKVAFTELSFHKIFTYAYDLRPLLYSVLEANHYFLDARLKQHYLFDGKYIDVVMHAKQNLHV